MLRRATPDFRRLTLVSALIAAIPGALLAQERPTPVLPPPSLYDAAPPAGTQAADLVATPSPTSAPARSAPTAAAAVVAPAPPSAAAAAPPPSPAPASQTTAARPAAATHQSASTAAQAAPSAPWYERMWNSVTRMFGAGEAPPKQQDPTMVAAVSPSSTGTTPVALPAARGSVSAAATAGYAQDTPERTIRTGMLGECVKTGMWAPSDVTRGCGAGQTVAKVEERSAMPAPVHEPRVEPVEVQPLAVPALKEEKSLEVEPVAQPQPLPEPEPAPAAMPEPPKPQLTTLSADALFAVGSHQLKPAAKASLDELAGKLRSANFENIKIVGHTDPTGKAALNDKLSKQRAESVKRYLVARGVPAGRIQTEGVGSSMPMVVETDCAKLPKAQKVACYQPDRRVEIEVQGVSSSVATR
jgi:OOP family OmpA-OmpF porin